MLQRSSQSVYILQIYGYFDKKSSPSTPVDPWIRSVNDAVETSTLAGYVRDEER